MSLRLKPDGVQITRLDEHEEDALGVSRVPVRLLVYIGLITIDGQLTSIPWYRSLDCSGEKPCYANLPMESRWPLIVMKSQFF